MTYTIKFIDPSGKVWNTTVPAFTPEDAIALAKDAFSAGTHFEVVEQPKA